MTKRQRTRRAGYAWLELLVVLAIGVLLLQLFPGVAEQLFWALDPRYWSQWVWFVLNFAIVGALVAIRYAPDWRAAWRKRCQESLAKKEKIAKADKRAEQKEMAERIKRGRSRRMY